MFDFDLCEKCGRNQGPIYHCYWGEYVGTNSTTQYTSTEKITTTYKRYRIVGEDAVALCNSCVRWSRWGTVLLSLSIGIVLGTLAVMWGENTHAWLKQSLGEFGMFLCAAGSVALGLPALLCIGGAVMTIFERQTEIGDQLAGEVATSKRPRQSTVPLSLLTRSQVVPRQ